MADNNDSLIREVDEELRREQLGKLWQRYGTWIVIAALAIPLGVLGYQWNLRSERAAAEAAGARFEAAANLAAEGKSDDAVKAYQELARSGPAGYAALSQLRAAGSLASAGKTTEAIGAYEALARDEAADPLLRDFGRLQAAGLRLGQADWTEMQNRLNDLIVDKAPWRYFAREMLGMAALKAGKPEEARKLLEPMVADPGLPQGLGERVRVLMGQVVAAEQAATAASTLPATSAAPVADGKK